LGTGDVVPGWAGRRSALVLVSVGLVAFAAPDVGAPDFAALDFAVPDFAALDFAALDFAALDVASSLVAVPDVGTGVGRVGVLVVPDFAAGPLPLAADPLVPPGAFSWKNLPHAWSTLPGSRW
jgi:hypothetical protein